MGKTISIESRACQTVCSTFLGSKTDLLGIFRKEMSNVICQSIVRTIVIVNGQAFSSIFFLVVFGLLWYRRAPFDTDFFTIAFVLISYLRQTYSHVFPISVISLSQCWAASNRIEVQLKP